MAFDFSKVRGIPSCINLSTYVQGMSDYELLCEVIGAVNKISEFASLNVITYADPLQWDITSQYPQNTVVIDPQTITAYLSVRPVPAGVQIFDTDYWTEIANIDGIYNQLISAITNTVYEKFGMPAKEAIETDSLVWIDNVLYKCVYPVSAGQNILSTSFIQTNLDTEFKNLVEQYKQFIETTTSELNARISNIIADGTQTEGNTELIDIRTGANGKVYRTAGDAVRGQIGSLSEDMDNIAYSFSNHRYEYGSHDIETKNSNVGWDKLVSVTRPIRGKGVVVLDIFPHGESVVIQHLRQTGIGPSYTVIKEYRKSVEDNKLERFYLYFDLKDDGKDYIAVSGCKYLTVYDSSYKQITNSATDIKSVGEVYNLSSKIEIASGTADMLFHIEVLSIETIIKDYEITTSKLAKNVMYRGILTPEISENGANLDAGLWFINTKLDYIPDKLSGFLEVKLYEEESWQCFIPWITTTRCYIRWIRGYQSSSPEILDWQEIKLSENGMANRFDGETVAILGDSISAMNVYQPYLKNKFGIKTITHAISGASWGYTSEDIVPDYEEKNAICLISQVNNIQDFSYKYWLLFAGTNDWGGAGTAISTNDDTSLYTIQGAMRYVVNKIYTNNPTAKIVIITPIVRGGENSATIDVVNWSKHTLKEYIDAIKSMADYICVPCKNALVESGINIFNYKSMLVEQTAADSSKYYLHPNDNGAKALADMIYNAMETFL